MTQPLDDNVLLAVLGSALAPQPVEPGPEAMAALHQALEARRHDATADISAVVVAFTPPKRPSAGWAGIHRLRHPVVAAVAVGVLATSGVAAAGVATDHLPGPTRNVAYALGLPVTSPALASAEDTIVKLRVALAAHDGAQAQTLAAHLRTQLVGLSAADRDSIKATADDQLSQAGSIGQGVASSVPNGANSSSGSGGSTSSGNSSNSGTSNGTTEGGVTSSSGESTTGSSSGGAPPGSSGSPEGSPGDTTPATSPPGTSWPGTTEPGDGSSRGPTTTPTTTPGTTPTTEPGEQGGGSGVGLDSQLTTPTTVPISPS